MKENKKTYYITVATGQISQDREASEWNFKIEASPDEVRKLREYFDMNASEDWMTFWRAHVPFMEYHQDKSNDNFDGTLKDVYQMIYTLGDTEAKNHIDSMGILK
ncbi:hydrolase [Peribacillus deserti]|uniref:Hydrolase n=1 Tax=Peribacillus deserti TaxID=673318 RepID=A0A2N5M4K0_9BACI|nr:hydrolase [Peribacillus deserti]PLT29296.1 hydrolase [Peribacillus deserti]